MRSNLAVCLTLVATAALAQDPTSKDFDFISTFRGGGGFGRGANQVILSPDGSTLAWSGPQMTGSGPSGLWQMPVGGGEAIQIKASGGEREMSYSPDGASIALISGRGADAQVYIVPSKGGEARQVTHFSGQIGRPAWSPDGTMVAFLAIANPTRVSGATQPFKPQTGKVGSTADVQRVAVVDVTSGNLHWASPADMYVYEFDWSPDSRKLAVTAEKPPGENNWWTAKLYASDVATGSLSLIATPAAQINRPIWSPDGHSIAYIGGVMSDFGSVGGDVYLVPASGGVPKDITPGHKGSPNAISWRKDGRIMVGETVEGESAIGILNSGTGQFKQLLREAGSFSGPDGRNTIATSPDGNLCAYACSTVSHNTEIYLGPFGSAKQLTHWNDNAKTSWGKVSSVHWKSGGFDVQGWLVAPVNLEPGKKYPMIVQVHGGPAAASTGSWFTGMGASLWSNAGYYVFEPNPRGSFGAGETFTAANRRDFGYGDWRDIMAGVDAVISQAPVDGNRLGLTGGSYGGYMTMWGVTQTHRFKAAVAVAGIANWLSYYGENSIDEWMLPYFGVTVYDDPKVYARSSPITFIKNVKTPTLIAVGEFDGECPPPQSYEFWHALNVLGVKAELMVYPGEGHGVRQPENSRDLTARELAWFNYYLK